MTCPDTLTTMLPRRRFSHFLWDARDSITSTAEQIWLCEIRRRHQVKMGSHGRCYRCGRAVDRH